VCELGLAARNQAGKYGSVNSEQTYRQRLLLESSENVDFVDVVDNRGVNRTDNRDFPEAFFVPGDSVNQTNYAAEVKKVKNAFFVQLTAASILEHQAASYINHCPRHQMSTIFELLGGSGKGMLLQVFLYDGAIYMGLYILLNA